ncbi:hypothetical protein [Actinorhabdospora filicis]|nr:hypothetical protein [Actinorhabdospora filicis]
MKTLGKLADRVVGRIAPKTTAAAVCVIKTHSYCQGTTLVVCYKDRCDLSQWCNYYKLGC